MDDYEDSSCPDGVGSCACNLPFRSRVIFWSLLLFLLESGVDSDFLALVE